MQSTINSNMKTIIQLLFLALFPFFSGCGGHAANTTSVTATAASIQLLVGSSQLASSGATTLPVTAVVLSSTGQTVANEAVVFSTNNDPSAYFSSVVGTTDVNGVATALLNIGANKSNRTVNISATAGTTGNAVGTNSVDVVGTSISISGNNSLALNASTSLTISVKDSAGTPVPGVAVTVTSQSGNGIALSPSSGISNSSGQVTATVTANKSSATDIITASASGTSKSQSLTVSSSSFTIVTPGASQLIPINTATPVSVAWADGGSPVVGSVVNFSSSRGVISSSVTTNADGVATASVTATDTGPAIISVTGPGGSPATSTTVTFYTTSVSTVATQATPGTIQVTTGTGGQTSNSSVISVVVRDAANNLVPNAQVNFSIMADASGGELSSATATTDSYGSASVNYFAGGVSSPQNGVTVRATVVSINGVSVPPVYGETSLTVSGQSLLVRLGTDNLVLPLSPLLQKTYVAVVTDAGLNPVAGAGVTFKLRPSVYAKGYFEVAGGKWQQVVTVECANEDNGGTSGGQKAFNGILDAGEDTNGNGALEPGGVATISATGVTDAFGIAKATITYPKDHAHWAAYVVEARTGVNTNDPPATAVFVLDGLAADYKDVNVDPPGNPSPFGTSASCLDSD